MHSRSLKQAVRYFLQAYWSLQGELEVKTTAPPGKPIGMQSPWSVTIHDGPQTFEGLNGFYPRFSCTVTFSGRLDGAPVTQLEDWLDTPGSGFSDVRDALAAFLHKYRYQILTWANVLVDSPPIGGIATNLVEAPRPLNSPTIVSRGPDWWGLAVGNIKKAAGDRQDMNVVGYSSDIVYGGALAMQNESPVER